MSSVWSCNHKILELGGISVTVGGTASDPPNTPCSALLTEPSFSHGGDIPR